MIARLIETTDGNIQLLCSDGTINVPNDTVLYSLLTNFQNAESLYGDDGIWKDEMTEMSMVPGETLAVVTDNKQLIIYNFSPFINLVKPSNYKYITVEEFAKKHNKSNEMVKVYLRQNRIAGAQKLGKSWIIPEDAQYPVSPEDQREITWRVGRPKKIK